MTAAGFADSSSIFDSNGRLIDWTDGFVRELSDVVPNLACGVHHREILKAIVDHYGADSLDNGPQRETDTVATDRDFHYRTASGRVIHVIERRTVTGGVHRLAREVTNERHTQDALADTRQRPADHPYSAYGVSTETRRMPDGSYIFEPISKALCLLLDLPPNLAGGEPTLIYSRFERTDDENVRSARKMEQAAQTLESFSEDYRIRDGNGRLRFIRQSMIPRREPDGTVVFAGAMRDVTQEVEARDQVEMLRSVVVQSSDAIAIFEGGNQTRGYGTILYVNAKFTELFGWSFDEVVGRDASCLAEGRTIRGGAALAARLRDDGKPVEFQTSSRSGRTFWAEARVVTIQRLAVGRERHAVLCRDISERKRDEQAIRVSEERFRLLADATNDVIWDLDLKTGTSWWNSELKAHYGLDAASVPDFENWIELVHPDDRLRVQERVRACLAGEEMAWSDEYRFRRSDGGYAIVASRAFLVRDDAGVPTRLLGSMADVTERRALEEHLARSQRLEAVGQLTGGVAHDFNNLITVILGNAEMLMDSLEGEPDLRLLAELTAGAAERGADLTRQLLAFARRQALEPEVVEVNKLIGGLDALLRRSLSDDIEIEVIAGTAVSRALVDPTQLESAVLNLAINARDAMPTGGKLTIETKNVYISDEDVLAYDDIAPGHYVMLSVSDTGIGMSPETLSHAFEPFFTTKDVGKGSGLGLSMIYGFLKQSGGQAKIYSEVGEGTTVRLYVPRTDAPEIESVPTSELVPSGRQEHVLAVEDDPDVRRHVVKQLQALGYQVTEAPNGLEALRIIRERADIDLLFTDVVMPGGMNGRQLANEALKAGTRLRVLFTSGYTENAIVHHGRLDPDVHFLPKPYRRRDLALALREALDEAATEQLGRPSGGST